MEDYLGFIRLFSSQKTPPNYLPCDGRPMTISSNQALFAVIGNKYGGDGNKYFNLPDLRGCIPMGADNGVKVGDTGGASGFVLNENQLPIHTHGNGTIAIEAKPVYVNALATDVVPQAGMALANAQVLNTNIPVKRYGTIVPNVTVSYEGASYKTSDAEKGQTNIIGANTPIDMMPPYVVLQWMICVKGLYPTRQYDSTDF